MLMLCFRDGREAWSQAGAEDCKGANPETTNPNRQQITPFLGQYVTWHKSDIW